LLGFAGLTSVGATSLQFQSADNIIAGIYQNYVNLSGAIFQCGGSVAVRYAEEASDVGAHSWSSSGGGGAFGGGASPQSVTSSMLVFWISPLLAPSAPIVLTPRVNDKFTIGSTQDVTYTSATDPVVDTEDLTYDIYYSDNNGITYNLIDTTAPGILTYAWDTTGLPAGTYKIKVVANNGTDDGQPGFSGSFQLFADVPPGAPTNLSPTGYISQAAQTFTWLPVNPDFDTQSHYELEWDNDQAFGSSSTTGTVASTAPSHAFSASTDILSTVGTFYWRVRTKGAVDGTFGPWSAAVTVIVSAAPATPTITSSNTATTALWPITFTAIAHTQFRIRLVLSGDPRLNTIVQSSAFSFTTPFPLANGEVWSVFVSVFDPITGLESAEATQTLTVSYIGPTKPTIAVIALSEEGAFQIIIGNATPADIDHSRIYRSLNGADFELISPRLGANALYLDYHVANDLYSDYNEYTYMARSYKVSTLGFTDSDPSSNVGIILGSLHLHVVDKTSTTSNASLKVKLSITDPIIKRFIKKQRNVAMKGRTQFITYAGQAKHTELVYQVVIPRGDTTTYAALEAVFNADATLCIRDTDKNKIFGRFLELPRQDDLAANRFTLSFTESDFREVYTR
jgi:hypothetical protein